MTDKKPDLTTREQALRVARMLGCKGAHETENGWMPCGSHEEYVAIKKGEEEYLKVLASKKKKPLPTMVQRTKRLETKSDAYYENRADAVAISKARGCGGVRTVMLDGKKYYAVCNHKAPKRGWENLDEKPISGIATLPGGGLVTGSFSGKALGTSVGRPIGGVSEIDGDGDGLTSNARGEDKIPVIARTVLEQIKKIGPEGVEMQLAQRIKGLSATLDDQDFSEVVGIDTDRRKKIVSQYDRMPVLDEKAKKAYDQFAGELDRQFKFLEDQGIRFEFVDEDPYKSFYEMHEDFIRNRRLKVMKTSVTGSHPYWSDATNDKFRAVHDVLGHLATGRGFDRHGEEAAYQAHKLTLPAEVHGALAMETRGQNAFLIERGDFPPQKAGVLPDDMIKKMFDALYTKQEKIVTSDDDNLFEIGGSHHVSGGRHFPKNKRGLVTGSFSGKSLGRPIGGVAEFDGDGDGFSTGPDGEDNIPVAPSAIANSKNKMAKDITKQLAKLFGKDAQEFKKSDGGKEYDKRLSKIKNDVKPDIQLEMIAEMQGFTGLPKVVSSSEMASLEKKGWTIAYRGIASIVDTENDEVIVEAKDLADGFRKGDYFAGLGAHGNGIHFSLDRESAEVYAESGFDDQGNLRKGEVIKVAIPPDFLMEREDFADEVTEHRERVKNGITSFYGDDDIGRVLVSKGVRGSRLNLRVSNGFVADVSGSPVSPNVILILDRSMLAVEESAE